MKRLYRYFLLIFPLFMVQAGFGQACDWKQIPGVQGHPPVLKVILGDFTMTPVSQVAPVGDPATVVQALADSTLSPEALENMRGDAFFAGLMSLSGREYDQAATLFEGAGRGRTEDTDCGVQYFRIVAQYLNRYPRIGDQPLFPNFNGGFYNFMQDSLYWGNKQDSISYDKSLDMALSLVQWSEAQDPIYLELLGDLLTRYRNRFIGNYFAALTYLRASLLVNGAPKKTFERKALFALEAPSTYEDRFNIYRFTQLRKALEADKKQVQRNGKAYPNEPISFFAPGTEGRLQPMLEKAYQQQLNREKRALKYKEEVEIGVVKKDTTFNMYALLVIGFIIGAVIFFWVQLRRNRN